MSHLTRGAIIFTRIKGGARFTRNGQVIATVEGFNKRNGTFEGWILSDAQGHVLMSGLGSIGRAVAYAHEHFKQPIV